MSSDLAPDVFLHATLTGDAPLSGLVSGVVEHNAVVANPAAHTYPLVTVAPYQPGTDTTTLDGTRVLTTGTWLVRVIGRDCSLTDLADAYDRIDAALQAASGENRHGRVYGVVRKTPFRLNETSNGVAFRHLGGVYALTYGGI